MSSDADFKRAHPVGYGFLVALGIVALLLPYCVYALYTLIVLSAASGWLILGGVGAFIIGICENIIKGLGLTTFSDAFTFVLLIVILMVKPTGIFGEKATDKV